MINKTIREIHEMIGGELILNGVSEKNTVAGVSFDSRAIVKNNIYIAIRGDNVDGHTFTKSAFDKGAGLALICDRTFVDDEHAFILVDDSVKAMQKLAAEYRKLIKGKVIGVTGSNGKTSLKDILAAALSSRFKTQKTQGNHNNEIGVPLTLLELDEDVECAIIEMGMENMHEIDFLNQMVHPNIGIITNVGIAHLANLGSIENIGRAKLEITNDLKKGDLFIYNGDDKILEKIIKEKDVSRLNVKTFGVSHKNNVYLSSFMQDDNVIRFKTNESNFQFSLETLGRHQAYNALAALICAKSLGLSDEEIQSGFDSIEMTAMRNELKKIGSCKVIDDSYKSNPQSSVAALETFAGFSAPYKLVIFGDMLDLGQNERKEHYDLGIKSLQYDYNELLLYGELSKATYEAVSENSDRKVMHFDSQDELYAYLKPYLRMDCMMLFKASRAMALDKVVNKLEEEYNG